MTGSCPCQLGRDLTVDMEPAFRRLHAEHQVLRALLTTADGDLSRAQRRRVAGHLAALTEHAAFEDRVLFPYLRDRVPGVGAAIDHALDEHEDIAAFLPRLLAELDAGRRAPGPALAALRHHLAEEEAIIVAPAAAAGLQATPQGEPGHILALHAALVALAPIQGSARR